MADFGGGGSYPTRGMVGTYMSYPPPPLPPKPVLLKRRSVARPVLIALVTLALCGMAVEGCFIYHLYQTREPTPEESSPMGFEGQIQPSEIPNPVKKPSKPMVHLIGMKKSHNKDGVMVWEAVEAGDDPMDEVILHEMKYENGKIIIQKEGYYSIYSKILGQVQNKYLFRHEVVKTTPRYPKEIVLLRSKRFVTKPTDHSDTINSYLGGVFHLFEGESIFVKVSTHTEVIIHQSADNYFGAYMVA